MHSKKYSALALVCLITFLFGAHAALASNRNDITFINALSEPITAVKILYDTPYDEPRLSSSDIILPPEREYRLGIQGVTLPTRIIVYLPLASYEFADLSGLEPDAAMRLEVVYEDGVPRLQREDDAEKSVVGVECAFLTPENKPYAVDRDFLTDARTLDDVVDLIVKTLSEAESEEPDLETILFGESIDERETIYFPVFWTSEYFGYAAVMPLDIDEPDGPIAIIVRIPLPEEEAIDAVDELMSDLRVDDYRPMLFRFRAGGNHSGEEVNFLEGDGDKYDDHAAVLEALSPVLENGTLVEAEMVWATEEGFASAKESGDYPETPTVRVRIANGQFQAVFLP